MQYTRLTKEQFEALHESFSKFLATQSIAAPEWHTIKKDNPKLAEELLDVFSDLVWEKVLSNTTYATHVHAQSLFLFKAEAASILAIIIQITHNEVDLTTKAGFKWLQEHMASTLVSIKRGEKKVAQNRNVELFKLIKQGAEITDGQHYNQFANWLDK